MRKLKKVESDPELFDRESIILLWKLLILLLRQNGVSSPLERNIAIHVQNLKIMLLTVILMLYSKFLH
jgi:hypothetical protein